MDAGGCRRMHGDVDWMLIDVGGCRGNVDGCRWM